MHSLDDSESRSRPWSDLLPEVIDLISKTESLSSDLGSFRQVCSNWRKHSIPSKSNILSPFLPCPVPPCDEYPLCPSSDSDHLTIVSSSVFLLTPKFPISEKSKSSSKLSPNGSWMVTAEVIRPGIVELRHAITGVLIKHSVSNFDLSDFEVKKLSDGYNLRNSTSKILKVLVKGTFAVVLREDGILHGVKLRYPPETSSWLPIQDYNGHPMFQDMVCFKGVITVIGGDSLYKVNYGADNTLVLECIWEPVRRCRFSFSGIITWDSQRTRLAVDHWSSESKLHLVAWHQDLITSLMMFEPKRWSDVPMRVKNYEFDDVNKRWCDDRSLDTDMVVFSGVSHTFLALAKQFSGCPRNSVVFPSDNDCFTNKYRYYYSWEKSSQRNLKTRLEVRRFGEENELNCPRLPQLMWPPPRWFSARPVSIARQ